MGRTGMGVPAGTYVVGARARDDAGAEGLGAFSIQVVQARLGLPDGYPAEPTCCGGGAEVQALPGLALALLLPRRRRRPR